MNKLASAATLFAALAAPAMAEDIPADIAAQQFARIASLEGRWRVAETDALEIVFEITARGQTVVERWETASGLHSMTVYHRDGEKIIATHYCPQGNQPRLETVTGDAAGGKDHIAFALRDITGLDEGESHAFSLAFTFAEDGSLVRSETYRSAAGADEPGSYTLNRLPARD